MSFNFLRCFRGDDFHDYDGRTEFVVISLLAEGDKKIRAVNQSACQVEERTQRPETWTDGHKFAVTLASR